MKKLWSLSTTVREAERILPFLRVLQEMEGEEFDEIGQVRYQTILIQNRLYHPTKLSTEQLRYYVTSKDKMSLGEAKELFEHMRKNSSELKKDPGLRGRVSVAALTKMGLAIAKKSSGKVVITDLGKAFLDDQIDIGDVFLKFFLKWQLPNPGSKDYKYEDGYDIKPFMGILHLINRVNEKYRGLGKEPKGISFHEFNIFVPSLINYEDIESYADKIIELRQLLFGKKKDNQKKIFESFRLKFVKEFLGSENPEDVLKTINNMKEYGDSARRYLQYTRYFHVRGFHNHLDLELQRKIEINKLLSEYSVKSESFSDESKYVEYMGSLVQPELSWENLADLNKIIIALIGNIEELKESTTGFVFSVPDLSDQTVENLKIIIVNLRKERRRLQEHIEHQASQNVENLESYIEILENIYSFPEKRPIILEQYSALGLNALNDAIKISPNYPVGDDNKPTSTAGANMPDIECYYEDFSSICEVTMLTGRDQWYNEGQPVMRHLRDFEEKEKEVSYCLFIAPKLHRDTINTFWTSVKYEFEGAKQKIIPLTITQFIEILKFLREFKNNNIDFDRHKLRSLYDKVIILTEGANNSEEWIQKIPNAIKSWGDKILI